jgi:hypothetical protein
MRSQSEPYGDYYASDAGDRSVDRHIALGHGRNWICRGGRGGGGGAGGAGGAAGGATGSPTGGAPSPAGVGPVGSPAAVNPASASPAGVISRTIPGVSISPSGNPPGTEGAAAAMPGLANRPGCAGGSLRSPLHKAKTFRGRPARLIQTIKGRTITWGPAPRDQRTASLKIPLDRLTCPARTM